jgi:hypothetical protein
VDLCSVLLAALASASNLKHANAVALEEVAVRLDFASSAALVEAAVRGVPAALGAEIRDVRASAKEKTLGDVLEGISTGGKSGKDHTEARDVIVSTREEMAASGAHSHDVMEFKVVVKKVLLVLELSTTGACHPPPPPSPPPRRPFVIACARASRFSAPPFMQGTRAASKCFGRKARRRRSCGSAAKRRQRAVRTASSEAAPRAALKLSKSLRSTPPRPASHKNTQ